MFDVNKQKKNNYALNVFSVFQQGYIISVNRVVEYIVVIFNKIKLLKIIILICTATSFDSQNVCRTK